MASRWSRKSAEEYLKSSETVQVPHGLLLLEKLNPKEGEIILDLGCGTGNLSVAIAEKTGAKGKVVAIDPDKNRIAVAKSTFGHIESIEFKEGCVETLPCEKSYFNAVFMNYVFHWIEDKKNALGNIYKVLKPGGRLAMLFNLCIPPMIEKVVRCLNPEENFAKLKEVVYFEEFGKIKNYCEEAGFVITEYSNTHYVIHQELSSYLAFVISTLNGIFDSDLIKEEKLNEFKMYLNEEGCVFDKFPIGVIIATKP